MIVKRISLLCAACSTVLRVCTLRIGQNSRQKKMWFEINKLVEKKINGRVELDY